MTEERLQRAAGFALTLALFAHFGPLGALLMVALAVYVLWVWAVA